MNPKPASTISEVVVSIRCPDCDSVTFVGVPGYTGQSAPHPSLSPSGGSDVAVLPATCRQCGYTFDVYISADAPTG